MKLFRKMKDGGPESTVTGYWLIQSKSLFSIVLLKFEGKSRQAYHTHAFNAISWLFNGKLVETVLPNKALRERVRNTNIYKPSLKPIVTPRDCLHKVDTEGTTWALSFRGPWKDSWIEYLPEEERFQTLSHGRVVKNST